MKRLTYKSSMGDYGSNQSFKNEWEEKYAFRNALGKYEDLGLPADKLQLFIPKFSVGSLAYIWCSHGQQAIAVKVDGFKVEHGEKAYKIYSNYQDKDKNWGFFANSWVDESLLYASEEEARKNGYTNENKN